MTIDIKTIEAYEHWWKTRPELHVPSPRECYVQQDKVMAVWISAWNACMKHRDEKDHAWKKYTEAIIFDQQRQILNGVQDEDE